MLETAGSRGAAGTELSHSRPQGPSHSLTFPLGKAQLRALSAAAGLSWVCLVVSARRRDSEGSRRASTPRVPSAPASHNGLPTRPPAGIGARGGGGGGVGRGRGRRAVPRARLLGALRYPRSGLRRPAHPRGGVRSADGRARGRERERERVEEAAQPRAQPRAAAAMAERRAFAQKISRYAAGKPAGPRGVGGWVWRGPPGLAAPSGACSPRLARPAGRAAAGRFFVSAVESAPALHAHAPAPGAPTKGTGEEATALTPAPAATADSTRGARSAPAALHPRLHTHTEAAVQSCGLRDTGAPRFPRGLGGRPFSRPRGRWMARPALCFRHGPDVHLLGVSHPPRIRFPSSLPPGPDKN